MEILVKLKNFDQTVKGDYPKLEKFAKSISNKWIEKDDWDRFQYLGGGPNYWMDWEDLINDICDGSDFNGYFENLKPGMRIKDNSTGDELIVI